MKTKEIKETVLIIFADYPQWEEIIINNPPYIPRLGESLFMDEEDFPDQSYILYVAERIALNGPRVTHVSFHIRKERIEVTIDVSCGETKSIFYEIKDCL